MSDEEDRDLAFEAAKLSADAEKKVRLGSVMARESSGHFAQYVLRHEMTGQPIHNAKMHDAWHRLTETRDRLIIIAAVDTGKLLPLDVPLPTPRGWRANGDIQAGDVVFGRDGKPCAVTWAGPVERDPVAYRITFDDGATIVAGAEHRWLAKSLADVAAETRGRRPTKPRRLPPDRLVRPPSDALIAGRAKLSERAREDRASRLVGGWRVVTTQQMVDAGVHRGSGAVRRDGARYQQHNWRIPITAPVQYPERPFPIHPYVLGVWLGSGSVGSARITLHGGDAVVGDLCMSLDGGGRWIPEQTDANRISFTLAEEDARGPRDGHRFVQRLRALDVLHRKHVPEEYLLGSVEQRRDLLAGLLDTDGSVGSGNRIEFTSTDEVLAVGCLELARSLGYKAAIRGGRAMLNGVDCGPKWRVRFTAHDGVFRGPRKAAMHQTGEAPALGARTSYRCVASIERVPSAPMRCIAVDSPDHTYLAGHDYVVTHNTQQISVAHVLFELGRNPNLRVAVVTKTSSLAQKIIRSIGQYIVKSDALHEVFPDLKRNPDRTLPWNVHQLTVDRNVVAKDPSVQATGIFGNIHGTRIDLLILDDVIDSENTRTQTPRNHLWNWVRATLMGRLTAAARVIILGNAFHPDDLLHRLEREPGYETFRFPVLDRAGVPTWPEQWPMERIDKARTQDMGPAEFSRALLCQARGDEDARFKREWIDACCNRGVGLRCLRTSEDLYDELLLRNPDWADAQLASANARALGDEKATGPLDLIGFYTGVDLAFSKRDGADLTCIFTIAVFPNGDRRILEVEAGRWDAPETMGRIESAFERYGSIVMVESVAAQRAVLDILASRSAITVVPHNTNATTRLEFQVEALAVELMNKKWIIPSGHEGKQRSREVDLLLGDLFNYDPIVHLSDRIAAMCFAVGCAKLHAIRSTGSVGVQVISSKSSTSVDDDPSLINPALTKPYR